MENKVQKVVDQVNEALAEARAKGIEKPNGLFLGHRAAVRMADHCEKSLFPEPREVGLKDLEGATYLGMKVSIEDGADWDHVEVGQVDPLTNIKFKFHVKHPPAGEPFAEALRRTSRYPRRTMTIAIGPDGPLKEPWR